MALIKRAFAKRTVDLGYLNPTRAGFCQICYCVIISDRKASIIAHKQTVPRQHRYGTLINTYARDMQDLVFARCH